MVRDMSVAARKYLFGLALLLTAGAVIGWLYGHALFGLMAAAAVALVWQPRASPQVKITTVANTIFFIIIGFEIFIC